MLETSGAVGAALLRAAVEIATSEGLDGVTLRKAAERAGYSKGAVQHHFASVEALRETVLQHWCHQVGAVVLGPARQASWGVGFVWAAAEAWLGWSEAIPVPFHALSRPARPLGRFSVVDIFAADWFEMTRAALERGRQLGELIPSTRVLSLAFETHALLWSTPWAWTTMGRTAFLTEVAHFVHDRLSAHLTAPSLLPRITDRLPLILDAAARLAAERERPDPHQPRLSCAAGLKRFPYEDILGPDDLHRLEWEQRHGRTTRTLPLPAEPDWWLLARERACRATPPAAPVSDPEERERFERELAQEATARRQLTPEQLAEFERIMAAQRAMEEEERRRCREDYELAEAMRNAP